MTPPCGSIIQGRQATFGLVLLSVHRPGFLTQTDTRTHTPASDDFKAKPAQSILSFINVPETQRQLFLPHRDTVFSPRKRRVVELNPAVLWLRKAGQDRSGLQDMCGSCTFPGDRQLVGGHVDLVHN